MLSNIDFDYPGAIAARSARLRTDLHFDHRRALPRPARFGQRSLIEASELIRFSLVGT